jgi:hypothetical protein
MARAAFSQLTATPAGSSLAGWGMSPGVVLALDHIFERWDGRGHLGLAGEAISLPARITHFAHTVVLERWRTGFAAAPAVVRRRAGGEFDPSLANVFLLRAQELVEPIAAESVWESVLEIEPAARPWLPVSRLMPSSKRSRSSAT